MAFTDSTHRDMVLMLTALLSYRALRGRRDELGLPLRADEQRRMSELERVFGSASREAAATDRPTFLLRLESRTAVRLAVELRPSSGPPAEGALVNLSIGGLCVETARPARIGERVLFKFLDLAAGRAWQFAAIVEWSVAGPVAGMGLRFTGIPLELRLSAAGAGGRGMPIAA